MGQLDRKVAIVTGAGSGIDMKGLMETERRSKP
jgi:hypothetical protein